MRTWSNGTRRFRPAPGSELNTTTTSPASTPSASRVSVLSGQFSPTRSAPSSGFSVSVLTDSPVPSPTISPNLTLLRSLNLQGNQLSGEFPTGLTQLEQLNRLNLYSNCIRHRSRARLKEEQPYHQTIPNNTTFNYEKSWAWASSSAVSACGFQKLGRFDASDLLNGSWVVVAGDSQARLVALSLLSLVLDSGPLEMVNKDLFKRHSDYQIVVGEIGMRLDFIWAPYTVNLTNLVTKFKRNRNFPDVLVMGSGLWHMLHFTNASDFGVQLQSLRRSAASLLPVSPETSSDKQETSSASGSGWARKPHLFWVGMPTLINSMLNTEEKRERMTDAMRGEYDKELQKSRLLRQAGGPLWLLDIESLSWNCGVRCTVDGMHYDMPVYEAVLHIMLNALLIESHQKL